jgi:hypothetical protein
VDIKIEMPTSNEWINPRGQSNQDTKTLGCTVAQGLTRSICQTTGKGTLQLRQERLDSKRNLLEQPVKSEENGT